MHRAWMIFAGVLTTFALAWLGLVLAPLLQLGGLAAQAAATAPAEDMAAEQIALGRSVYVAKGCVYCHSQQVRGGKWNADLRRGWGGRRSVPADYAADQPHLLGTMRTGPDLSNVGARLSEAAWHYRHLYEPTATAPGSIMPPYRYLFEKRRLAPGEPASPEALPLPAHRAPGDGWEVVPTERARALVAYLVSLKQVAR